MSDESKVIDISHRHKNAGKKFYVERAINHLARRYEEWRVFEDGTREFIGGIDLVKLELGITGPRPEADVPRPKIQILKNGREVSDD